MLNTYSYGCLFMVATLVSANVMAAQETYVIDTAHSFVNFSIRHVVAKTSGSFNGVTGNISIDKDNLTASKVEAKIAVNSISTGLAKRDEHIKKPEYLDAVNFGEIVFTSQSVESKSSAEGVMKGQLTMHGVTKDVSIPFKVLGFGNDPWGGQRSGFEGHTVIKASDFGFTWMAKPNAPVGDEIEVTLLIEGVKK